MSWIRGRLGGSAAIGLLVIVGAVALSLFLEGPASAAGTQSPSGAEVFAARCASCHQAEGQGVPGTFPPLADNPAAADAEYVAQVIAEGRTGTLKVDGVSYMTPMPAISAISDDEIAAVVDYVVELSGGAGTEVAPVDDSEPETAQVDSEPETAPVDDSEPEVAPVGNSDRGKDLFVGSSRLDEGGAACASCHTAGSVGNLGGSGLGPDLTSTHTTLGGDVGLAAWLTNPPSVTMNPIFADRPLSEGERADLVAFLADAPSQKRPGGPDRLLLAGLGGLVLLILGMSVAWRGMRQTYISRLRSNL